MKTIFFRKRIAVWGLLAFIFCSPAQAASKIRVVASMSNLADFTRTVAGPSAEVYTVANPGRDIHFIQPTPRDVLKVKKANVFVHPGLDLEAWRGPLLDAAGNAKFMGNGPGAIDASAGITLLEIPSSVSRLEGDIHLFGNPHYWTDPENAKIMVQNVEQGLARLYPEDAGTFKANADKLNAQIDAKLVEWKRRLAPYAGTALVTYHNSWPYFARCFGFEIAGNVEPKPGIPPTARHLHELVNLMKGKKVRLVIKETYQESRAAEKVAREAGVPLVTLYQFAGQGKTATYLEMMEKNVAMVEENLRAKK